MFGRKAHAAHVEFLKRQLAALDAALAPRAPVDYNAEFARQQAERTTSLTVIHAEPAQ